MPHCHIGPYTMMLDNDYHRVEPERRLERPPSKPIVVEDNVWIGARVIVMAGVTVGEDSCVGAAASSRPTCRRERCSPACQPA